MFDMQLKMYVIQGICLYDAPKSMTIYQEEYQINDLDTNTVNKVCN